MHSSVAASLVDAVDRVRGVAKKGPRLQGKFDMAGLLLRQLVSISSVKVLERADIDIVKDGYDEDV